MKRVLIIDTSILCTWFKIPGKETCGPSNDLWDWKRVDNYIKKAIHEKATLVLPLATIIETGNHISQSEGERFVLAQSLSKLITDVADQQSPWAAFAEQSQLWNEEGLKKLAREWPELAKSRLSIGDATIKQVAEYYGLIGWHVEILTGDQGLKAYQPLEPTLIPRRRQ